MMCDWRKFVVFCSISKQTPMRSQANAQSELHLTMGKQNSLRHSVVLCVAVEKNSDLQQQLQKKLMLRSHATNLLWKRDKKDPLALSGSFALFIWLSLRACSFDVCFPRKVIRGIGGSQTCPKSSSFFSFLEKTLIFLG